MPKKQVPVKTTTYTVLRTLKHDGEIYQAGDSVDLSDDQANTLLDIKAVAEVPKQITPPTPPELPSDQEKPNAGTPGTPNPPDPVTNAQGV